MNQSAGGNWRPHLRKPHATSWIERRRFQAWRRFAGALLLLGLLGLTGCERSRQWYVRAASSVHGGSLQLTSPAFRNGDEIPAHYTCDGENVSPPLEWSGVPAKTLSLALIVDDPDAPGGDFTHWVLYGLLPATLSLPGNLRQEQFAGAASQGANDFQSVGYGGPCPPPGAAHHYIFTLFALDTALNRPPGISRAQLEAAMKGHIIAQARLMGTYQRQ